MPLTLRDKSLAYYIGITNVTVRVATELEILLFWVNSSWSQGHTTSTKRHVFHTQQTNCDNNTHIFIHPSR